MDEFKKVDDFTLGVAKQTMTTYNLATLKAREASLLKMLDDVRALLSQAEKLGIADRPASPILNPIKKG